MAANPDKFQTLLYAGISAIQQNESQTRKKNRSEIHQELAESINRKASTIEYYLQGNIPSILYEVEQLAKVIYIRGKVDEEWLRAFLKAANHKRSDDFIAQLVVPSSEPSQDKSQFQCKRLSHYYQRVFSSDRNVVTTSRIQVQAISQYEVSSIRHRTVRGVFTTSFDRTIYFTPISRDTGGTITHKVFNNSPDLLRWFVVFDPPLQPGEVASYEYKHELKGISPWTLEECRDLFHRKMIPYLYCATSMLITMPTDVIDMSIVLPPNYDVTLPSSGGFQSTLQSIEDLDEKTRLIRDKSFTARYDTHTCQWTLELSIQHPKIGYTYSLEWIPPSENTLKSH